MIDNLKVFMIISKNNIIQFNYINNKVRMVFTISQELLHNIGLTQFQFDVLLFTLLITLLLIFLSNRFAVFKNIQFSNQSIGPARIIYVNNMGAYDKLENKFNAVKSLLGAQFQISKMFGLYYDNPQEIKNPNLCRSSIGMIINIGELSKVQRFLKQNPSFRSGDLQTTRCLSTYFPYINKLSFFLIVTKVYPKLKSYMYQKKIQGPPPPVMEIYHFLSDYDKSVQVLVPLENIDDFLIWEDDRQRYVDRKSR